MSLRIDPKSNQMMSNSYQQWSLATRLTLWYASSAFVLILIATGLLYFALAVHLDHEDDRLVRDKAHLLRVLLQFNSKDETQLKEEIGLDFISRNSNRTFVRILSNKENVLFETPGMADELSINAFPSPSLDREMGRSWKISSKTGKMFQALSLSIETGGGRRENRVIQVAMDRSSEEVLLSSYRTYVGIILALALLICTLLGYWIARRGMKPLEDIAQTAKQIKSTTLHQRIEIMGLPSELSMLGVTFNEMLDRLQDAFVRLSQFSSDIAHELRTPINTLQVEAEVALGKARSTEEYREVISSSLEEYGRLSRMIGNLLFLARAENPQTQIKREPLMIQRELNHLCEFYESPASVSQVTLEVISDSDLTLNLDRHLLQRAVGNLLSNALRYTASGGRIAISARTSGSTVEIEVADTGCGIPSNHLPYVFDRFYRVDRARSSDTGNLGLGLSIVKSIAALHGGSIKITSDLGRGTAVTLVFPHSHEGTQELNQTTELSLS